METEMMSFEDVCAEIRQLLAAIPQERWIWTRNEGDAAALSAKVAENLGKSDLQELWGVALDEPALHSDGEARTVCFTGNGPNSQRHARLLMLVRAVLPELLARACPAPESP